jgi:ribosome-associated heat shock protein Hsp15
VDSLRMDHYLFRARLFKSRSKATSACKEGRVFIDDKLVKASSEVKAGELVRIRDKGLYTHYRILELPQKNISKADAKLTWADETPEDIKTQREQISMAMRVKPPKWDDGRPSKKDRRTINKLRGRD